MEIFILIGEGWKNGAAILGLFETADLAKASDAIKDRDGKVIPVEDRKWRDEPTRVNFPTIADTSMDTYLGTYPSYSIESHTLHQVSA
jgi:hypothetical protein